MPDSPSIPGRPPTAVISTSSQLAVAGGSVIARASFSAAAWPTIDLAIAAPVQIEQPVTVYQLWWENGTTSGNADIAVYDQNWNRKVSAGSTSVTGTNTVQAVDVTDTALQPGVYFLALCFDNTSATVRRMSALGAVALESLGVQQQALGAVTLPDPFVPAIPANAYLPLMGMVVAGATF